jgi:hypothetical protein
MNTRIFSASLFCVALLCGCAPGHISSRTGSYVDGRADGDNPFFTTQNSQLSAFLLAPPLTQNPMAQDGIQPLK